MCYCLLNGNVYVVIQWGCDGQLEFLYLYVLGEVVFECIGQYKYKYIVIELFIGVVCIYLQEEILYLCYLIDDGFLGCLLIIICCEVLGLGLVQQCYGVSIMKDGMMVVGVVIIVEWFDSVKGKQVLDVFECYKGVRNVGKILIFEGGMDYKQFGMSNQDVEWLVFWCFIIEDIVCMFNVFFIFLQEYSNSIYSNFSEVSCVFFIMIMCLWLVNFEQQIKFVLLVVLFVFGICYQVEFDFVDFF